jgi:hypothetical protein
MAERGRNAGLEKCRFYGLKPLTMNLCPKSRNQGRNRSVDAGVPLVILYDDRKASASSLHGADRSW